MSASFLPMLIALAVSHADAPRWPAPEIMGAARQAAQRAVAEDRVEDARLVTVIDYRLPSTEPRLWVLDLAADRVLYHELVAHGGGTGENEARDFSNVVGSKQSSIGVFVTAETYVGSNGYSLRLDGLEPGFNDQARRRAIVMHGAWYVSEELAGKQGRIGRSWGCPAVREPVARELIDTIAGGTLLVGYYPDEGWLTSSEFVAGASVAGASVATAGRSHSASRSYTSDRKWTVPSAVSRHALE